MTVAVGVASAGVVFVWFSAVTVLPFDTLVQFQADRIPPRVEWFQAIPCIRVFLRGYSTSRKSSPTDRTARNHAVPVKTHAGRTTQRQASGKLNRIDTESIGVAPLPHGCLTNWLSTVATLSFRDGLIGRAHLLLSLCPLLPNDRLPSLTVCSTLIFSASRRDPDRPTAQPHPYGESGFSAIGGGSLDS